MATHLPREILEAANFWRPYFSAAYSAAFDTGVTDT
jgi:hypothetical protein